MHSIRFKITAITIAEILVAIMCVFLISFSIIQTENDRSSVEAMDLMARDTQKALEKYTEGIEQSVEMASNLAAESLDSMVLVQDGVIGEDAERSEPTPAQRTQLDAYLAEYIKKLQVDSSTVASHTRGVVTYYYCISPDISALEHGFFYSRAGKTGFVERDPLDARELDLNDVTHTSWYSTPISRGRPSWVGPYTAHFLNEMMICSYVVPIYKSGTLIGVLGMDIPLETLITLVSSTRIYDTGFACLLDEEGHVLYHPELDSGVKLDIPAGEQLLQKDASDGELIRYKSSGEERQMSFTTLSNGMRLVIVAPTAEVKASSRQLAHTVPVVAIALVVSLALLTFLLVRLITRPLLGLTAASKRLATADYDVELSYKGKDEVGMLTDAFQQMRDQLQVYIADLNRRLLTDELTGLPNQRHFFDLAVKERDRMLMAGGHPVMLFFNLAGMKHFNRQFGFDEGDRLICEVANILARRFGKHNTSHFGQDHFAAVADEEDLEATLFGIFRDCSSANGGKTLPVSVGIYQNSLETVAVSVACDRAKFACDSRRGTYYSGFRYFDAGMLKRVELLRYVVNNLERAIDEKWIEVHYQPIVRAVSGKVCDEEALSRWIDPTRGFMSPGDFIPALEDSGLIYRLDLYVLEQALEKMKQQRASGLTVVPHSINLSRSDFDVCDIVEEIRVRVDASGFSRDMITVEITESIIGSDFDFMKEQIERFQQLGFPVWMDDFGSGYSSLDFLQSIKFDLLKFDMSFLRKLDESENGKIILTELMQMATAMGVDTICEGVETESQIRFLREIGCSKLQGYYFCKPIPLSEILARYKEGRQIGYENPEESEYYEAVGRTNLYDLTTILHDDDDEAALQNIFNTLPMSILEITDDTVVILRTNPSYRDFMMRYFGIDLSAFAFNANLATTEAESFIMKHVRGCCGEANYAFFDEMTPGGSMVHFMVRRISTSPVTGTLAVAVAVLNIRNATD